MITCPLMALIGHRLKRRRWVIIGIKNHGLADMGFSVDNVRPRRSNLTAQLESTDFLSKARFQFDRVQRWLHWTTALLIFVAIGLGVVSAYLPVGQQPRKGLLEIHKSLGFTILGLIVVRVAWRLSHGEPPYRQPLGWLVRIASRAGHAILYFFMIFMPITGYLFSAAGGYSLPWFGLFQWPRLLSRNQNIAGWGEFLHDRGAWGLGAILFVHLAAVAWHRWVKNDEVLSRMTGTVLGVKAEVARTDGDVRF